MKRLGFMSYTSDPSLRLHHYGPIEPMEYDPAPGAGRIWALVMGIGLGAAILYMILRGELPI